MSLPFIEKYRPKILKDVIGNTVIIKQFKSIAKKGNMPHMLLVGPPGTGKTTSINCLARELLKDNFSDAFLELNASNERGIDVVRNKIKDFCKKKVTLPDGIHKIIFLDEVESMTTAAQQAMRRIIEQYAYNTRFSMACNSSNQLIEAIQSRCTIKKFSKIKIKYILKRLENICELESIKYEKKALTLIIKNSKGDMRKALIILQTIFSTYNEINLINVKKVINIPENQILEELIKLILKKENDLIFNKLENVLNDYNPLDLLYHLFEVIKIYDIDNDIKLKFINELASTEIKLLNGALPELQFISLFYKLLELS